MAVISPEEFRCRTAIAVARPLLPSADALLPYLRRIDQTRIYGNMGPLTRELEERLARHFSVPSGSVATVANATLGLTLALQALGSRAGSLCLMPAWTFAASGHAAVAAGLRPYFLDVDADDWCIKPDSVMAAIGRLGADQVGAVMPVAPFGGAAFHDGWTFHGSPPNERADAQRRSIISHLISTDTRWNPAHPHPIYSRYRRPSELELDEAFFPVLWQDGYSTI